jgi:hypothetical protein
MAHPQGVAVSAVHLIVLHDIATYGARLLHARSGANERATHQLELAPHRTDGPHRRTHPTARR